MLDFEFLKMAQLRHHNIHSNSFIENSFKKCNGIFRITKKFKTKELGKVIYNDDQVIIGLLKVSYLHQALAGIVVAQLEHFHIQEISVCSTANFQKPDC